MKENYRDLTKRILDNSEKIVHLGLILTVLSFCLGFLIINCYYGKFGLYRFSIFRPTYSLTGFVFILFLGVGFISIEVIKNNIKEWRDEAKMTKVLLSIFRSSKISVIKKCFVLIENLAHLLLMAILQTAILLIFFSYLVWITKINLTVIFVWIVVFGIVMLMFKLVLRELFKQRKETEDPRNRFKITASDMINTFCVVLLVVAFFSMYLALIYPLIPRWAGGGMTPLVNIKFVTDAQPSLFYPLKKSDAENLYGVKLLDQENGYTTVIKTSVEGKNEIWEFSDRQIESITFLQTSPKDKDANWKKRLIPYLVPSSN